VNFTSEIVEDVLILTIFIPRPNASSSESLKNKLLEEVEKNHKKIIIDLHNVEFTDSSFLGALLAGHKSTHAQKGEIILVGLKPQVKNVFNVTHMDKIFMVKGTVEQALTIFNRDKK